MKAKKLIRYRVAVSRTFPATHPRKGEETYFKDKIQLALGKFEACRIFEHETKQMIDIEPKMHTIRGNKKGTAYEIWAKRFEKINKGEAVLELYYWSGKPYNSKCVTICQLGKDDGIGVQKLTFLYDGLLDPVIDNITEVIYSIAKNDGLSWDDFKAWFKGYDLSKPMAIIHFTNLRY